MTPEHTDSAEPAPCPFCGKPSGAWQHVYTGKWSIGHSAMIERNCSGRSGVYQDQSEAISAWNRVALAPAALKRLVEANDAYQAQTPATGFGDKIYRELEAAWKEARSLVPPTGGRSPVRGE